MSVRIIHQHPVPRPSGGEEGDVGENDDEDGDYEPGHPVHVLAAALRALQ